MPLINDTDFYFFIIQEMTRAGLRKVPVNLAVHKKQTNIEKNVITAAGKPNVPPVDKML